MDLLSGLNDPQRTAVTHVNGPLLVLAGAGSGKTRVITRRIAHLIEQGVAPWNILAITFTNKAAGEMAERVEALHAPRGATICTFHSLCARLLREFAHEAGVSGTYSIYDREDQLRLIKQAMDLAEVDSSNIRPAAAHATISNAKNELLLPPAFAESADGFYERQVARIYEQYHKLLAANNAVDFDDLLLKVAFLLKRRPDLRQGLSQRYRYILIDEYQDTNHVQYLLAHGIAMDHQNICVTGDPDQSIYAWRGANIRNILEFENDYPDATVIRLEENYRSTASILAAASSLIACNTQRKDKRLWTQREGGPDVLVAHCDDEQAEARLVARRIARYRDGGGDLDGVAVFYRVNSLSRVLEEVLLKEGLPYRVARGVAFYNRKEIKDVLAYCKLLANPADDLSCLRIINTPTRGIGATTVKRLVATGEATGQSVLELARAGGGESIGKAATRKLKEFAAMIDDLRKGIDRPASEVLEAVYEKTRLDASFGDEEDARQAKANVDELISAATEFESLSDDATLPDFLHHIGLVSDVDRLDGAPGGAVTLMTLHAAKGLEFPAVFIVGWEEGMLPFERGGNWGGGSECDVEEERRLAFVGMTRAMDELTISAARRRRIRGRMEVQAPSRFLDEIGSEGVTVEDETSYQPARQSATGGGFYADMATRERIESGGDWQPAPQIDPYEMQEQSTPMPPEYEHLSVGSQVYHPKFGPGKVLKLSQPWPETRAQIHFRDWGIKKIVLAMAKVELM